LLRFLAFSLAQANLFPDGQWLADLSWPAERALSSEIEVKTYQSGDRSGLERFSKLAAAGVRPDEEPAEEVETFSDQWVPPPPLPVMIELRNFARMEFDPASPLALWQYVVGQLKRDDLEAVIPALQQLAQQGQVLFLLDGVDEVPPVERAAVWRAIAALDNGPYGGNRWVATCRVLSFVEEEAPAGIPRQTLRSLDEEQVDTFISSWFGTLALMGEIDRDQAEIKINQLQAAARGPRLQSLAQNPMLLTIMALVQTYHGTLPKERAMLYQACVEVMLLRWQHYKDVDPEKRRPNVLAELGTTQEKLERLLWEIAWTAHSQAPEREEAADIPEGEILTLARKPQYLGSLVKAALFLDYTEKRAHLLLGRGGESERLYTFPHRTFQEYLAASHLASVRRFPRQAPRLAAQGDTWREVLILAAGTLVHNRSNWETVLLGIERTLPDEIPEADDVEAWSQIWLAGEMATVVGKKTLESDLEMGQELLIILQEQLAALLSGGHLRPPQRAEAGVVLARLGDPRPGVGYVVQDGAKIPAIVWGKPVPAGTYKIGGDPNAFRSFDERQVTISEEYMLARYPVTYAQFQCFVHAADFGDARWWAGMPEEEEAYGSVYKLQQLSEQAFPFWNHPRERVSWYQAIAFCRWLSDKLDYTVDLPTEQEWEVAARYPDGRFYPWGNEFDATRANTDEGERVGRTSPVGMYPDGANQALELYDLSGNVWEWCRNKFEEPEDRTVDAGGARRVLRGGSWSLGQNGARSACRLDAPPAVRSGSGGFRLVVRRPPSQVDH
jgi:formylglycine-generating enzyme required for sulfatase activity